MRPRCCGSKGRWCPTWTSHRSTPVEGQVQRERGAAAGNPLPFPVSAERKMCVVIPRNLGKVHPLRVPRCIPSGYPALSNSPVPTQPTPPGCRLVAWLWVRGNVRAGATVWPLHRQSGRVPAPRHPMTRRAFLTPLDTHGQPCADWMPSELSRPEPRRGEPSALPATPSTNRPPVGCGHRYVCGSKESCWANVYPLVTLTA